MVSEIFSEGGGFTIKINRLVNVNVDLNLLKQHAIPSLTSHCSMADNVPYHTNK